MRTDCREIIDQSLGLIFWLFQIEGRNGVWFESFVCVVFKWA